MATQPNSIEALLGVRAGMQASRLSLPASIESGLPVAALDRLADKVAPGDARFIGSFPRPRWSGGENLRPSA